MQAASAPAHDLSQTYRLLELLFGPEVAAGFVMPHPKRKTAVLYGTLDECADTLVSLNSDGHAPFFQVGNVARQRVASGKAAQAQHIMSNGFVWLDLDAEPTGELTNLGRLQALPVPPSAIVQTSQRHKLQAYWKLVEPITPDQAKAITAALAKKLGGDPKVCRPNALLRLPGFRYEKNPAAQAMSKLLELEPERYSAEQITEGLKLRANQGRRHHKPRTAPYITSVQDSELTPLASHRSKAAKPPLVTSVQDYPSPVTDASERARLEQMRKRHAAQREAFRYEQRLMFGKAAKVGAAKGQAPNLPAPAAAALSGAESACEYVEALAAAWRPGIRQELALSAGCDLYRFGYGLEAALAIIEGICSSRHDRETRGRLRAVRSAYRAAKAGKAVKGAASSSPSMTVFEASAWGCDLRKLAPAERRSEARRRVLLALDSIPTDETGKRKHSARTLAERTGISYQLANEILNDLQAEGVLERVTGGSRPAQQPHTSEGVPELEAPPAPVAAAQSSASDPAAPPLPPTPESTSRHLSGPLSAAQESPARLEGAILDLTRRRDKYDHARRYSR